MRAGIVVNVTRADRLRLEAIVADRSAPQKHVWHAKALAPILDIIREYAVNAPHDTPPSLSHLEASRAVLADLMLTGFAINSLLFAATAVGFARLLASARRPGTLLQMGE